MEWYYVENDQQAGPVSRDQLVTLARGGRIRPTTLVWREGMPEWQPFSAVAEEVNPAASADAAPDGQAVCVECKGTFPANQMIRYEEHQVCAGCKPVFFQRLREEGLAPGELAYAGFWIRVGAKLLDQLFLTLLIIPFVVLFVFLFLNPDRVSRDDMYFATTLFQVLIQLFYFAIAMAWNTFFVGRYGATPGKMICGLKVVMATGEKLTYWRAFGRYFAEMLSQLTFYVGYLIVAFDAEKRALHDYICSTRVVRK